MIVRTIPATVHGRYVIRPPEASPAAATLVMFHGYAESADQFMERSARMPDLNGWLLMSIQGLHRFYRGRTDSVVASWMTRQDRELAIDDNNRYVTSVIDAGLSGWPASGAISFAGFSQGVAMAFRAACGCTRPVGAVVALGGDVPPELDGAALKRIPIALLGRGARDEWYTADKIAADAQRLRAAGTRVEIMELDAAHEWPETFSGAVSGFLATLGSPAAPTQPTQR